MASFAITKQQQQKLASRFSFKGLKTDIFNLTNMLKNDTKEKDNINNKGKDKKAIIKMQKKDSFLFKGIIREKQKLFTEKNVAFFYQFPRKALTFKILSPTNALSYQYAKEKKDKKIFEISKSISFNLEKNSQQGPQQATNIQETEEKLKKMIEDLNNSIKSKDEEIQKVIKEKADMELLNQLFTESSNEQIENLSKENKEFKEKNEKLNEENKSIKEELEQKKTELENKTKECEDNRNNLNKTIEELTKDNSNLKLDLLKKKSEIESLKNSPNTDNNAQEKEKEKEEEEKKKKEEEEKKKEEENSKDIDALKETIAKLKQEKIIETSQLKIEVTKYKVEMKRLTTQLEKLKEENNALNKANEENMNTLKINDVVNNDTNEDINLLKNKNKEYQEQINKMKAEIEEFKKKDHNSGGGVDAKQFEEIRQQNRLYYTKLQEAQKKILQANALVSKAKKYSTCVNYASQVLALFKPENDKQTYLFIKLKGLVEEYEKEKSNKK